MAETLVKYKTAKLAEEKGFSEICLSFFVDGEISNNNIGKLESYDMHSRNCRFFWGKEKEIVAAPSQSVLRKWLIEEHKIYIELIIDGWKDDQCVSDEYICYRGFIWQIGKPKPGPADDIGAAEYEIILESALLSALELIETKP